MMQADAPTDARTIDRERFDALLVDLDGVVTRTAAAHAAAWKRTFDEWLADRPTTAGEDHAPFSDADYRRYVDGKPRYEGVRSFLAARGIDLPDGAPSDPPARDTVCGIGNRKNEAFRRHLREHGVAVFPDAVRFLARARDGGFRLAVVSSSRNCAAVLGAAHLEGLFEERVDGTVVARQGLPGKPDPAMFREAARRLGVAPQRAVVLEDAQAGVAAGDRGGFGLVVGVDRGGDAADALRAHGADVVVTTLTDLTLSDDGATAAARSSSDLPSALDDDLVARLRGRRLAVFLDYDGTLTPIVARPEQATLGDAMRAAVDHLARVCIVAVVSGRDRSDVARMVGLDRLVYAGSHGFDIALPDGRTVQHEAGAAHEDALRAAERELGEALTGIDGAWVESKRYALAVHLRQVDEARAPDVEAAVAQVADRHPDLRTTGGKKIVELRPCVDWDKGRAVLWLLEALELAADDVAVIYVGDDDTDEDAFAVVGEDGMGVLVTETARPTRATHVLPDTDAVRVFLDRLAECAGGPR